MARTDLIVEQHTGLTLGASEIAAAAGLDPWRSTLQLYLDKLHGRLNDEQNDAMLWGMRNEYHVLQMHARIEGVSVLGMDLDEEPCLFRPDGRPVWSSQKAFKSAVSKEAVQLITETCVHPNFEFLTCHPDGFQMRDSGWIGTIVQAKNMSAYADLGEHLPGQYQLQAQHELLVITGQTGSPLVHSTSIFKGGSQLREFPSKPSPEVAEYIISIARDFIRRIEEGDPPSAEPTEQGARDLARLFPGTGPGMLIKEGTDLMDAAEELEIVKRRLDGAKEQKAAAEVRIRELMGEHTSANDIDKTIKLSLSKQQVRKTVNWKAVVEELQAVLLEVDGVRTEVTVEGLKLKHTKLGDPFRTLRATFK